MKVTLKNGVAYTVDDDALGDMEIFENLVEIEKGNPLSLPETIKALIGEDGYSKMKESVRNEKGRVKTEDFMAQFGELMKAAGELGKKK